MFVIIVHVCCMFYSDCCIDEQTFVVLRDPDVTLCGWQGDNNKQIKGHLKLRKTDQNTQEVETWTLFIGKGQSCAQFWRCCYCCSWSCSVPQLNNLRVTQYVHPHPYFISTGSLHRVRGLCVRPFPITPPCIGSRTPSSEGLGIIRPQIFTCFLEKELRKCTH